MHQLTEHDAIRVGAASSARLLTASALDAHPSAMSRLAREGVVRRVVPGVYVGTSHPEHTLIEAAAWTTRHPQAVAALLTAAIYHDLTDAFARGTWLYVPFGTSPPRSRVVPVHVVQIAPRLVEPDLDEENGISRLEVHGVAVRITNADRTTLDLWRYPRRISREVALDALRRRVKAEGFEMPKFARLGQHLGVWERIEPVAQGLVMR